MLRNNIYLEEIKNAEKEAKARKVAELRGARRKKIGKLEPLKHLVYTLLIAGAMCAIPIGAAHLLRLYVFR